MSFTHPLTETRAKRAEVASCDCWKRETRRTKVIGRFPGETSCLSLCWPVLDLVIAGARGLGLTAIERQQIHALRVQRIRATTIERSA